jgi:DEAD/DEAH box helicase domain-containing protein
MPTPPPARAPGPPAGHESFHAWLRALDEGEGRIAAHAFLPPRRGERAEVGEAPWAPLAARLGVRPWRHQAAAWRALGSGGDVVLATGTASGKSLVYQLPVLEAVQRGGAALLLFPTKALAADQLASLRSTAETLGLDDARARLARYDGDTPRDARRARRERADALITNPDMLHLGILPFHPAWARFLARLEWIVVDELHAYRGVLGSHVANVLRRLLRLCAHYGASPRLISASATIANPGELFAALTGREAAVVADDAAPHGPREVVFWEPPQRPGDEARRRSPVAEAADLAVAFAREGVKSLFFCNSRKAAELLTRYARARLGEVEGVRIDAYRAGYDPRERRRIERAFADGEITVLASTSALELGVDVGGVDAVAMVGYPGSSMAFWQRAGRAGRSGHRALTVMVPGDDPLDDHYLRHPEQILDGGVEAAVADGHNEVIHPDHLRCAAAELPVAPSEGWLAPGLDLATVPGLRPLGDRYVASGWFPHRRVSLRGGGTTKVRLVEAASGRSLGAVDRARALRELHEGAVHLHRGEPYLVVDLDLEAGRATLLPHIEDWYTQVRGETRIEILEPDAGGFGARLAAALRLPAGVRVGRVRVVHEAESYVRKRYRTGTVLEERPLDLPPETYETQATWLDLAEEARTAGIAPGAFPAAMHALEHAMIGLLPAFVLCERADVGGVSYPLHPQLGVPALFVYDGAPGGVGYAAAGAHALPRWLEAARERLASCPCRTGCPRCVLSPKCGNGNQHLDKAAAARLATALLGRLEARLPAGATA